SLLSASLSPSSLSFSTLAADLSNYDFRYSLVDIPLVSILRSAVIFCVYNFCDGPRLSRGPYLGITAICSVCSLIYVSAKAPYVFSAYRIDRGGYVCGMEAALFLCSLFLAIGHVVVAYRTSCRERRKLLVYKIDIEAICTEWTTPLPLHWLVLSCRCNPGFFLRTTAVATAARGIYMKSPRWERHCRRRFRSVPSLRSVGLETEETGTVTVTGVGNIDRYFLFSIILLFWFFLFSH
ncbi:unnamed protein product, partial [Linum tenue]